MGRKVTDIKKSAGGFETTTADANKFSKIISLCTRIKVAILRGASVLATCLRGLA
ncbi:hypothetical protein RCH09_003964 [Actimicrobium sp. GrIS 1.19]|uniref:hypothetical protein n=1 Tax=Actimicrobium sp. GrIS 1.19 TaxID=3071708 RepID=UPI002E05D278|nr:hypothetical protein [Actimicrobium sp. GrIS 1.19]